MKKIWHLIVLNEEMEIVSVESYTEESRALSALRNDYKCTKEMLSHEGWDEENLEVDEISGSSYWLKYGESSYYGEVCASMLHEEE